MKKFLLFLLLISLLPPAKAQTTPEPPDTVKVLQNASNLTVSRSGDTTTIEVTTQNDYTQDLFTYEVTVEEPDDADDEPSLDFEIPFGIGNRRESKSKSSSRRRLQTSIIALGNIYVGQRFNYSDKGNIKNFMEAGIRNVIALRWSHGPFTPSFSVGLGFGTQNYRAQDGFVFAKDGSKLVLIPVQEGYDIRYNIFQIINFQVPLLFTIPIGRDVTFVAGAVGCFNTYASARTELKIDTSKYTTRYKGFQQRLFTAELTASLGICDILGVYAS